ncbi:acyl-protein synthetase [Eubacterium oxidoreducens]|uniref:Phenylacetate-coenzyme A ligase PaaK, adenylate-forming domain family n=1 Tax=Eubacterium oxidoreducens TaxID=1732 RepID=A0A1G6B4S1_EUBOX|nr:acyl-protein synthetase [Eubacterium oxidoreducens]SDB15666.1 Phenylacetate-coenzyme A ligase PaaK, adenylate-forming domain family [Eubacterium oxidoreducens]
MDYEKILSYPVYALSQAEKEKILIAYMNELTTYHKRHCEEYRRFLKVQGIESEAFQEENEIPYLPVRIFKDMELRSIEKEDVFKVMTSSGTTGQQVSRIYLDKETAAHQQKTLSKIMQEFLGKKRIPMLIIDTPSVIKNRQMFSARGAGILGFSMFGSKKMYALDDDMKLDVEGVRAFVREHEGEPIFIFGFTFMIWQYFYKPLKEAGIHLNLERGIMVHGGGWKKLVSEAVEPLQFHKCMKEVAGIESVHDYYGMVEQTGCVYMECEEGHLHASVFSDVIMRRAEDFSECEIGEEGIVQVLSMIPKSYPGHSILTEDKGIILGVDDCPCKRKGKYFKITGRIKQAEVRGCSDTFEKK